MELPGLYRPLGALSIQDMVEHSGEITKFSLRMEYLGGV